MISLSFMNMFFFISLGITFVLLLLLVYHFKHRLTILEQKYGTLFEIVNNVVKELSSVKKIALQNNILQSGNGNIPHSLEAFQNNNISNIFSEHNNLQHEEDEDEEEQDEEEDEDEEEEDEDEDEEDEEEETEDETDFEEDEEEGDEIEDEENETEDESDDEEKQNALDEYIDNKKNENNEFETVNETINQENDYIDVKLNNEETIQMDETIEDLTNSIKVISIDLNENNSSQNEIQMVSEIIENAQEDNIIQVNKLDIIMDTNESATDLSKKEEESYRKLNITQLKALVISRGLATDTNKLKKNDLIKLLENSE